MNHGGIITFIMTALIIQIGESSGNDVVEQDLKAKGIETTSPLTISGQTVDESILHILFSQIDLFPAFSVHVGETTKGILEVLAAPLMVSGQVLDAGVIAGLNSFSDELLPESLQLSLPNSFTRGIEAWIDSPSTLSNELAKSYHITEDALFGLLLSPVTVSQDVSTGKVTLKTEQNLENVFPGESNDPFTSGLGALLESPLRLTNVLFDKTGLILNGIVGAFLSPLTVSGDIIAVTLNAAVAVENINPDQSNYGQPDSFKNGMKAVVESPINLFGTIHDGLHDVLNGIPGLLTSPLTVISGNSPVPIPGSATNGANLLPYSPQQLAKATSGNIGLLLEGFARMLSGPVSAGLDIYRFGWNVNRHSVFAIPEQLRRFGIPKSVAYFITAMLKIPVVTMYTFLGSITSPLRIVTEQFSGIEAFYEHHEGDESYT